MHSELEKVLTFSEATKLWNLSEGALRQVVFSGKKLKEDVDYRKSGKVWIIRKASMERIYGKLK